MQKDNKILEIIVDSLSNYLDTGQIYSIRVKKLVTRINDLKIHVYSDHYPPHFHVISTQRDINAKLLLSDLSLLDNPENKLRGADINKIQDFFRRRPDLRNKLNSVYNDMNGITE